MQTFGKTEDDPKVLAHCQPYRIRAHRGGSSLQACWRFGDDAKCNEQAQGLRHKRHGVFAPFEGVVAINAERISVKS